MSQLDMASPTQQDEQKRTLDFRPSLQMASQSARDCSEAQGLVSSIYVG